MFSFYSCIGKPLSFLFHSELMNIWYEIKFHVTMIFKNLLKTLSNSPSAMISHLLPEKTLLSLAEYL